MPAAGFQGDCAVLNVDDNSPQAGPDGRIQEGIDLVTLSTVRVHGGTYDEGPQAVVDKTVSVIGVGLLFKRFTTADVILGVSTTTDRRHCPR